MANVGDRKAVLVGVWLGSLRSLYSTDKRFYALDDRYPPRNVHDGDLIVLECTQGDGSSWHRWKLVEEEDA